MPFEFEFEFYLGQDVRKNRWIVWLGFFKDWLWWMMMEVIALGWKRSITNIWNDSKRPIPAMGQQSVIWIILVMATWFLLRLRFGSKYSKWCNERRSSRISNWILLGPTLVACVWSLLSACLSNLKKRWEFNYFSFCIILSTWESIIFSAAIVFNYLLGGTFFSCSVNYSANDYHFVIFVYVYWQLTRSTVTHT